MFQSTRPHGARRRPRRSSYSGTSFQSTRPHGARPATRSRSDTGTSFQSTRPHGARHQRVVGGFMGHWFQSTRPHGARPLRHCQLSLINHVSIHAPARGATMWLASRASLGLFQSTRPHGARLVSNARPGWGMHGFNPRARTGRDLNGSGFPSIWSGFNPRARTGRDPSSLATSARR